MCVWYKILLYGIFSICTHDVGVFCFISDGILCQDVMMLNFFPELSASEFSSSHEFIFVIDRSGLYDQTTFTVLIFCFVFTYLVGMALN